MNSSFVCSRTFYLFFLDTRNLFLIESCFFRSALKLEEKNPGVKELPASKACRY